MKLHSLAVLLGFIGLAVPAAEKAAKPPATSPRPATASAEPVKIPQSVFTIPATPKEGRNPFFPNLAIVPPPPIQPDKTNTGWPQSAFVLNGITSPPRRTAMINGRTMEVGEEAEVRLASGDKVLIKCVEIGDSSAAIMVGGQRRELKLRSGI